MFISSLTRTLTPSSTGANVPEDLFERILDFLDEEIEYEWYRGDEKKRRDICGYSLTCRYWARRCQPRMFEQIRLRSKEDIDQLLSLLESTSSRISGYIKHLHLIQKNFEPWIYLVPLQLVPKLFLIPTITLNFYGPWEETHTKRFGHLRSIHCMLPSARPEFSSHISYLDLYYLRFRCFEDMARLVGELRSLHPLHCFQVEWSSPVPENYVIPVCPPSLNSVKMIECTDNAVGFLLLLGRRRRMLQNEAILPFRLGPNQQALATPLIYHLMHALINDGHFQYTIKNVDGVHCEQTQILWRLCH